MSLGISFLSESMINFVSADVLSESATERKNGYRTRVFKIVVGRNDC